MYYNWKKLRKNIPNRVHTGTGVYFDVVWQNSLPSKNDSRIYGMTTFNPNTIILDSTQTDKQAVHTFFHEFLHAISDTREMGITERQVQEFENCFKYFFQLFLTLNKNRVIITQRDKKSK